MPKRKPQKNVKPVKVPSSRSIKKEIASVKKELNKIRRPIYALNKKIKQAPSKYYERKFKKEKQAYLDKVQSDISSLVSKRTEASQKLKNYNKYLSEKSEIKRELSKIKRQKIKADESTDWKQLEKLSYKELKLLQQIDKINESLGAKLNKTDVEAFDVSDYEDDPSGYVIDENSPYAIWEAVKQFHIDLENPNWKYIVINGTRYSTKNKIELIAEASTFWIDTKTQIGGTPFVNRFTNEKKKSVKYQIYSS